MHLCIKRFHIAVSHQQQFHIAPIFGISGILDVHNLHRHASLEQRQRKTIEIAQLRIVISLYGRSGALKHQRICHQHGYAPAAAHAIGAHGHRVERIDHNLHLG